jgi:hypothetical protein
MKCIRSGASRSFIISITLKVPVNTGCGLCYLNLEPTLQGAASAAMSRFFQALEMPGWWFGLDRSLS